MTKGGKTKKKSGAGVSTASKNQVPNPKQEIAELKKEYGPVVGNVTRELRGPAVYVQLAEEAWRLTWLEVERHLQDKPSTAQAVELWLLRIAKAATAHIEAEYFNFENASAPLCDAVRDTVACEFLHPLSNSLVSTMEHGVWIQLWDEHRPLPWDLGDRLQLATNVATDVCKVANLVIRHGEGVPDAFNQLWSLFERDVDTTLERMVSAEFREDIKHNIWIRLRKAKFNLAFIGRTRTRYLHKIVVNACHEHRRRHWMLQQAAQLEDADGVDDRYVAHRGISKYKMADLSLKDGIPPHQFIAAIALYLQLLFPRQIAEEHGNVPLETLASELLEASLEKDEAKNILTRMKPIWKLTVRAALKSPNARRACHHILDRRIGDTCLADYANGKPLPQAISQWAEYVGKRLRKALKIVRPPKFRRPARRQLDGPQASL